MADTVAKSGPAGGEVRTAGKVGSNGQKARNRKVYQHEMTEAEKFALQTCLKAKNALSAIAVHIQEGKGCKPEIVQSALAIQSAAASVLFG